MSLALLIAQTYGKEIARAKFESNENIVPLNARKLSYNQGESNEGRRSYENEYGMYDGYDQTSLEMAYLMPYLQSWLPVQNYEMSPYYDHRNPSEYSEYSREGKNSHESRRSESHREHGKSNEQSEYSRESSEREYAPKHSENSHKSESHREHSKPKESSEYSHESRKSESYREYQPKEYYSEYTPKEYSEYSYGSKENDYYPNFNYESRKPKNYNEYSYGYDNAPSYPTESKKSEYTKKKFYERAHDPVKSNRHRNQYVPIPHRLGRAAAYRG